MPILSIFLFLGRQVVSDLPRQDKLMRLILGITGMSQASLGKILGKHETAVSRYVSGERNIPIKVLVDLSRLCQLPIDDLIFLCNELSPEDESRMGSVLVKLERGLRTYGEQKVSS